MKKKQGSHIKLLLIATLIIFAAVTAFVVLNKEEQVATNEVIKDLPPIGKQPTLEKKMHQSLLLSLVTLSVLLVKHGVSVSSLNYKKTISIRGKLNFHM